MMDATTGRRLDYLAHLRQSVTDILTTPLGSRVMRRDYGSLLPEMIDRPLTDATLLQVYAATVMALLRWEPRLRVTAVRTSVSTTSPGRVVLDLEAQTREGEPVNLEVPLA